MFTASFVALIEKSCIFFEKLHLLFELIDKPFELQFIVCNIEYFADCVTASQTDDIDPTDHRRKTNSKLTKYGCTQLPQALQGNRLSVLLNNGPYHSLLLFSTSREFLTQLQIFPDWYGIG